jgi:hypothetical protein
MHVRTRRGLGLASLLFLALCLAAHPAAAQNPTGSIAGRVTDASGLAVAGATVTAASPQLQGTRAVTTSTAGAYILALLPPGQYTVTITLDRFASEQRIVTVAATEPVTLDITLRPADVSEAVTVRAEPQPFATTVQASTNIRQDLTSALPTARTLLSAANLAPALHLTGPSGSPTVAGAMSFENVFLLNGVQIQDNLRGTPFNLFIEDAIQETTIATSGVSAEYGRFTGGVIHAITKSGGNQFSGSYRVTLTNDDWRTVSPFGEPKTKDIVPTHETTLGGPIRPDRLWFFGAGRAFEREQAQQTGFTNLAYVSATDEKRFEGKVTGAIADGHRLSGSWLTIRREEVHNAFPSPNLVMDLDSLVTRQLPQDLYAAHYTGLITPTFFVEAQYSRRTFTFENDGGRSTDLIDGTLLLDQQTGATWFSPSFCGVCTPERRDSENVLAKATKYLSTSRLGTHQITVGYDLFNDQRRGDNHQSGSDFHIWTTTSFIEDDEVFPLAAGNGSTWIINWPIRQASQGTNFRTHSAYVNDSWRAGRHLSMNLGVRFDQNRGRDAVDKLVASGRAVSPRLGAVIDPRGDGAWTLHASYGRYVAAIANSVADASSPGGTPAIFAWFYEGPDINADPGLPLVSSREAIRAIFDWFNANGGTSRAPFFVEIPGVATQIRGSLASPSADEYSVGLSAKLGSRGSIRADVVRREFGDFYADRVDTSTGFVEDEVGQRFDLNLVENTDALTRRYTGLHLQFAVRAASRVQIGGNYTLSQLAGNVNGENVGSGPLRSGILSYPEFFDPAWSFPEGDLAADQRHRLRLWTLVDVVTGDRFGRLSLGVIQQAESGSPYGAVGAVRTGAFVDDPGYMTPPDTVNYFFTGRDAFRTEAMYRTDLSANYAKRLGGRAELFAQVQVLNLFNQFQVFNITGSAINTTVLTAFDDPDRFATFNPFTETPVQGVHWDFGDRFGEATGAGAFTLPRTALMSVGVRF